MDNRLTLKNYLSSFTNADAYLASCASFPKYLRVNTIKTTPEGLLKVANFDLQETQVPNGFTTVNGSGNTLEHFLGLFTFQTLSSQLPVFALDLKEEHSVLDLCAAPGMKTTQIASDMKNEGLLVAVDKGNRISSLVANLERMSIINTVVQRDDARFAKFNVKFDKVLADVPCSCLGDGKPEFVNVNNGLPQLQECLAIKAFDSLKSGGEMVYSTCTINPQENEVIIDFLLEKRPGAKLVETDLKFKGLSKGLKEYACSEKVTRVWPQEFNSEGFFIAKVVKIE